MKFKLHRRILLLILTITFGGAMKAAEIVVDGLTYYISDYNDSYASLCSPEDGDYSGDIVIPSKIKYNYKEIPVTRIFAYAFCYDRELTSVTIPNSIKEIDVNAFLDCRKLKTLIIPESVEKLGRDVFGGCTLNPLIIKTTKLPNYRDVFERMEKESIILASSSEISKIKPYFDNVYDIDTPYTIEIIDTYLKGVKFRLVPNEYCSGEYKFSRVEVNGNKVDPSDDGTYFFKGLSIYDSKAEIQLYAINDDGAIQTNVITFSKKKPSIHLWYSDVTQTTVTFRVNAYYDETTAKPEIATVKMCESTSQVYSLESSATFTEDQAIVKFNDLTPNTNYSDYKGYGPMVYVRYYDGETFRDEMSNGIKTKNIEIQYENEKIGVTDYSCNFKYH